MSENLTYITTYGVCETCKRSRILLNLPDSIRPWQCFDCMIDGDFGPEPIMIEVKPTT